MLVIMMGRKGWTQIEVPSGWTQIIPSVQWPPADSSVFEAQPFSRFEGSISGTAAGPRQVMGDGQSGARSEGGMAAVSARLSRLEAALQLLGEDSPDAAH